jgi:poly-gamma-glutamate synthesis protein (capsule biosynthesis protein)
MFEVKGKKAAFIAFTDNEPAWEAKEHKPGVHYVPVDEGDPRAKRLFDIVVAAKNTADSVIVSAHWGPNWGYEPVQGHVPFAHRLINSGAHIVFGHSCHVFQGVEFYRGGVIIYSAGDFIDDYAVDEVEKNDESFLFLASVNKGVRSLTLCPTVIEGFHADMAEMPRAGLIAAKMKSLSAGFGTRSEWDSEKRRLKLYPGQ